MRVGIFDSGIGGLTVLKELIEIFTDKGDVVIDPCAGSGTTLRACAELGRSAYGFEIKKEYCKLAKEKMLSEVQQSIFGIEEDIWFEKLKN